jgi:hypothetical protein
VRPDTRTGKLLNAPSSDEDEDEDETRVHERVRRSSTSRATAKTFVSTSKTRSSSTSKSTTNGKRRVVVESDDEEEEEMSKDQDVAVEDDEESDDDMMGESFADGYDPHAHMCSGNTDADTLFHFRVNRAVTRLDASEAMLHALRRSERMLRTRVQASRTSGDANDVHMEIDVLPPDPFVQAVEASCDAKIFKRIRDLRTQVPTWTNSAVFPLLTSISNMRAAPREKSASFSTCSLCGRYEKRCEHVLDVTGPMVDGDAICAGGMGAVEGYVEYTDPYAEITDGRTLEGLSDLGTISCGKTCLRHAMLVHSMTMWWFNWLHDTHLKLVEIAEKGGDIKNTDYYCATKKEATRMERMLTYFEDEARRKTGHSSDNLPVLVGDTSFWAEVDAQRSGSSQSSLYEQFGDSLRRFRDELERNEGGDVTEEEDGPEDEEDDTEDDDDDHNIDGVARRTIIENELALNHYLLNEADWQRLTIATEGKCDHELRRLCGTVALHVVDECVVSAVAVREIRLADFETFGKLSLTPMEGASDTGLPEPSSTPPPPPQASQRLAGATNSRGTKRPADTPPKVVHPLIDGVETTASKRQSCQQEDSTTQDRSSVESAVDTAVATPVSTTSTRSKEQSLLQSFSTFVSQETVHPRPSGTSPFTKEKMEVYLNCFRLLHHIAQHKGWENSNTPRPVLDSTGLHHRTVSGLAQILVQLNARISEDRQLYASDNPLRHEIVCVASAIELLARWM